MPACKLTPERQEKIIDAIRAGNYAQVAAVYAGIDESTHYNWMKWGEERGQGKYFNYFKAVKEATAAAEVRAVAIIQKHMPDQWAAAMTYLERKHPDRWSRNERREVTTQGNPLAFIVRMNDVKDAGSDGDE